MKICHYWGSTVVEVVTAYFGSGGPWFKTQLWRVILFFLSVRLWVSGKIWKSSAQCLNYSWPNLSTLTSAECTIWIRDEFLTKLWLPGIGKINCKYLKRTKWWGQKNKSLLPFSHSRFWDSYAPNSTPVFDGKSQYLEWIFTLPSNCL